MNPVADQLLWWIVGISGALVLMIAGIGWYISAVLTTAREAERDITRGSDTPDDSLEPEELE